MKYRRNRIALACVSAFTAATLFSGCTPAPQNETAPVTEPPRMTAEVTDQVPETTEQTVPETTRETVSPILPTEQVTPMKTAEAEQYRLRNVGGDWWETFSNPGDNYVFVADSAEELTSGLKERNLEDLDMNRYDDTFFTENRLALIPRSSNSGSVRYSYSLTETADGVEIGIYDEMPDIGTMDMADWLVAVPLPRDSYPEGTMVTVNPAGASFLSNASIK